MPLSKRTIASRTNGARSKGPKTESGKRRSSMNSIRHGLLAQCVVLRNEGREYFETLCREFHERFQPADNIELACVEEMAAATWRLRRVMAIETNLMNREIDKTTGPDEFLCVAESFSRLAAGPELALIDRYENRLHRLYHRSFNNLLRLQELRAAQERNAENVEQEIEQEAELDNATPDPNENTPVPNEPTAAQPPVESMAPVETVEPVDESDTPNTRELLIPKDAGSPWES